MRGRQIGMVANPGTCHWCGAQFTPRPDNKHGFCTNLCRQKFLRAARIWTAREIVEGRLTIEEMKVVL